MANYVINWSGGSIVVPEGTIDSTSTSLELIGDGASPWGRALNQDLVHLLENFAAPSPPASPIPGQLWYDSGVGDLKLWNGSNWQSLAGTVIQGPTNRIHDPDDNTWVDTSAAVDTVSVATDGVERLRVQSTGEVGIGTTLPNAKLHVAGGGSLLRLQPTTGDGGLTVEMTSVGLAEIRYAGQNDATIDISPVPTDPGDAAVSLLTNTFTSGTISLKIGSGDVGGRLWGDIDVTGDGYIAATGRYLGVGEGFPSLTPAAVLHVAADTWPQLALSSVAAANPALAFRDDAGGGGLRWWIELDRANDSLRLVRNDGYPVLELKANGRVRVSGTWDLPADNGDPGDILVSDGFGGSSWQAPPFVAAFDSGVINQTGTRLYTATHGFGSPPRAVRVTFVAIANNNGYSVGDEIQPLVANEQSTSVSGVMSAGANNVDVWAVWWGDIWAPRRDGTGTFVVSENSDWGIRIRAWL